jgi:hypothetical protein
VLHASETVTPRTVPTGINVDNVGLEVEDLLRMSNDIELPGEVLDLFHDKPLSSRKTNKSKFSGEKVVERTPTKATPEFVPPSPRRSPRLQSADACLVFIIIKFTIYDTTGVDARLDIPKIFILSHNKSSLTGLSASALQKCLQDKTNARTKHQFDLCE